MKRKTIVILLVAIAGTLTAQNNVGINTSTPDGILDVHAPSFSKLLISTDGYASDTSSLTLRNMIGNTTGTEFIFESRNEEGLLLRSRSDLPGNTNQSILMMKPDGEIGVGFTNPEEMIHLHNETINQALIKFTTATTGLGPTNGFTLGVTPSGNASFTQRDKHNINFSTDFQIRMSIDSLGMVSIGGAAPSNFLTLKHNSDADDYGMNVINDGAGNAGIYLRASNWFGVALERSSQLLRIGKGSNAGNINGIAVHQSGRVGIGTTSTNQQLNVEGKLKIGDDSRIPVAGTIRYNAAKASFEGYDGGHWKRFTNRPSSSFIQPTGFWSSDPDFTIAIDRATISDNSVPASAIIAHVDVPDSSYVTQFKVCLSIENVFILDTTEVYVTLIESALDGTNTVIHSGTIEFLVLGPFGSATVCHMFELAMPHMIDHDKLYRISFVPLYIPGFPNPQSRSNSWGGGNLSVRNASIYYVH